MNELLTRIGYLIVPAGFLVAAFFFFKEGHPIAGGFCVLAAILGGRN